MNSEDLNEKQKKAGNPIFILIIFVVLLAFVFYAPEIYQKYNQDIVKFFGIGGSKEEDPNEKYEGPSPRSAYYMIGSHDTFDFNEITISDMNLSQDKILSLKVSTEDTFNLDTSGYYIEFYRNKDTFIGRRTLHGIITKSLPIELDVSNLDIDTVTYYVISRIEDSAIGGNSTSEKGIYILNCQNRDQSYMYEFYNSVLTKATYKYTYTNSNLDEYASKLLEFQKIEKDFANKSGISATISENSGSFVFLSEFDYGVENSFKEARNYQIFDKGAKDNIVKFKIEAEGYECK